LERREVQRLGSDEIVQADARVVAATSIEVEHKAAINIGFRGDVLDRLVGLCGFFID
jgi:transcriptional regulator with GAF, ATPase, and Fis domain